MRLTTRKKLAELKRCQLAGGSPPPGIELNQEDNDIIDIVGTEYFYEEMNGELKPENFMSGFDYVPEHFCDAILTAAAVSGGQQSQHMQQQQHNKDPQQQQHVSQQQQQQDHHTNDGGETSDAAGSSNHTDSHGGFQTSTATSGVPQMQAHNGDNPSGSVQQQQQQQQQTSNNMPHHPAFHGGLHPHLLRRQHAAAAMQRESAFEEKLLQLMQDVFPKKGKKRKSRDPDKLFLLSLYEEIKRVPEEIRLDVKSELIQVLKKYQKKSPVKQEKSHTHSASSSSAAAKQQQQNDKIQLSSHSQLPHSMYNLQKKYDKNEKEPSPQSQVERVQQHVREATPFASATALHTSQHSLLHLQKKYEESGPEKVHDQRKHVVESPHQQQHPAHQQPPPPPAPSNEQHLHHTQIPHNIMFPLSQIRNEQPNGQQQHHTHNPHQQQSQQQHQHQQSVQQQQHHPPTIFGTSAPTAMSTDRPTMPYENVG